MISFEAQRQATWYLPVARLFAPQCQAPCLAAHSHDDFKRCIAVEGNAPTLIDIEPSVPPVTYAGIEVIENPLVPPGKVVFMDGPNVLAVLDIIEESEPV